MKTVCAVRDQHGNFMGVAIDRVAAKERINLWYPGGAAKEKVWHDTHYYVDGKLVAYFSEVKVWE